MNLFIDTTNWKIIYILEQTEKILDFLVLNDVIKTSDLAIAHLDQFLKKNQCQLKDIQNFYLTTGPGSYTGIRVGMTIVKTIKTLNPKVNVYLINSLLYQAGMRKAVSILDAKGQKFYLGVYNKGELVLQEQLVLNQDLDQLLKAYQKQNYEVLKDYQNLNPIKNYLELKTKFKLVQNVEEIEPLYIKGFI